MDRNIPTVLDEALQVFAPPLAKLMEQFTEVSGLTAYVARQNPAVLPLDDSGRGYADANIESAGASALMPLVHRAYDLVLSSKVLREYHEPLSLSASRGKYVSITASVSAKATSVFAHKKAACLAPGGNLMMASRSELNILCRPDITVDQETALNHAAYVSADAALSYLEREQLVLNGNGDSRVVARQWFDDFASGEKFAAGHSNVGCWLLSTECSSEPRFRVYATGDRLAAANDALLKLIESGRATVQLLDSASAESSPLKM